MCSSLSLILGYSINPGFTDDLGFHESLGNGSRAREERRLAKLINERSDPYVT